MRDQLCRAMVARAGSETMVFLTGDLGFMVLEPLRAVLGQRFINCGVAEQNMVTVAAAMAREGMEVWTYTIAPFCYARAFEQIRNDLCFHRLPVKLIANGGGYGYGVMGPTHHALEDYGVLLTLDSMCVFVPAFDEDIAVISDRAAAAAGPSYIRLGRSELPEGSMAPEYAPWRQLLDGYGGVAVAVGPMVGGALSALRNMPDAVRPQLWVVCELPLAQNPIPERLVAEIARRAALVVIEEHVPHGGVGQAMGSYLVERGICLRRFLHLAARGYPSGRYGSQAYHRKQVGLDPASIHRAAVDLAKR